jgi:hypothetical protein
VILPIRVSVFERGPGGVPSSELVASLHETMISYQHSISSQFGFESMSVSLVVSQEDAIYWLANGLMREAIVSGPDGGTIWQGFLNSIDAQIGQETRTLSLDGMANAITCKYTLVDNTPGTTAEASESGSQSIYGRKAMLITLAGSTQALAERKRDQILAVLAYPRARGTLSVATGDIGDVTLTLNFTGWYSLLDWTRTTLHAVLASQFATISDLGITWRQYGEEVWNAGLDASTPYAWGVWENRIMRFDSSVEIAPTTIDYYRSLGEGVVRDSSGGMVNWWDIRPNTMYAVRELMDLNAAPLAPDTGGVSYIGRVSCSMTQDSVSLDLEGRNGESVDQIVARVR